MRNDSYVGKRETDAESSKNLLLITQPKTMRRKALPVRETTLQTLSKTKIEVQEEERRRIARELHDGLGQTLSVIKFNLEVLEDSLQLEPTVKKRWEEIKSLLDNAMVETKEIAYMLMPPVLQDFGLIPALQFLCDQISKNGNCAATLTTSRCLKRFPTLVEIGLFRIVQEALNNIFKHAHASRVSVGLTCGKKDVRLTIEDNGKGFEFRNPSRHAPSSRGIGLINMRERAEVLQGSVRIDSRPGHGTSIIVEIPLES